MKTYVIKRMKEGNWWYVQSPNDATPRLNSSVATFRTRYDAFLYIAGVLSSFGENVWDIPQVMIQEVETGLVEKY